MFNSLRARLIGICVAITVAALFALALATFIVVRNNTLHEMDQHMGQLTISFVEPVGPQGQPTAVVGSDIHLDSITRKVNAIHPTPNNFAFLVDGGGNILAHTKTEYALKPVTTIAPKLDQTMLRQLADNGGRASLPIDGKAQALEDIASGEGDLTRRLDTQGNDELTQISQAFNHFLTSSPG